MVGVRVRVTLTLTSGKPVEGQTGGKTRHGDPGLTRAFSNRHQRKQKHPSRLSRVAPSDRTRRPFHILRLTRGLTAGDVFYNML